MNLSNVALAYNAAKAAGFTGSALLTAVAIAAAESGFDPNAVGDVNLQTSKWGPSIGLWQIRSLKSSYLDLEPVRDPAKLADPFYNAKAAFQISKGGSDFSPWSTFVNQAYKAFLNVAETVVEEKKKWVSDYSSCWQVSGCSLVAESKIGTSNNYKKNYWLNGSQV